VVFKMKSMIFLFPIILYSCGSDDSCLEAKVEVVVKYDLDVLFVFAPEGCVDLKAAKELEMNGHPKVHTYGNRLGTALVVVDNDKYYCGYEDVDFCCQRGKNGS